MILIILAAILSAWNHCELLINRGDWQAEWFRKFMFWQTDQNNILTKVGDSFHVIYNAFVVVLIYGMFIARAEFLFLLTPFNNILLDGALSIYVFWYIRNWFLHVIFRVANHEYYYFLPMPLPTIYKLLKKG